MGKIQVKRGLKENLPTLDVAEPAFTTDTKECFIGSATGNVQLVTGEHLADNASHVPHLGTTTNAGNVYSVTSTEVVGVEDKFSVKFNAVATNTATLNISSDGTARTLKKPDGSDFKPKAGIYSFIRDGVNFQLLGEGGEYGTAGAPQTLTGYTLGTENGVIPGSMPSKVGSATIITPSTADQAIPQGYYGGVVGDGKVSALSVSVGDNVITYDPVKYVINYNTTFLKFGKRYTCNVAGVIRLKLTTKGYYYNEVRIYKNGVGAGIIRSNTTNAAVEYIEDFPCSIGDYFEVYGRMINNSYTADITYFKACGSFAFVTLT